MKNSCEELQIFLSFLINSYHSLAPFFKSKLLIFCFLPTTHFFMDKSFILAIRPLNSLVLIHNFYNYFLKVIYDNIDKKVFVILHKVLRFAFFFLESI